MDAAPVTALYLKSVREWQYQEDESEPTLEALCVP